MVEFNKIKLAIEAAGTSSEKLATKIEMSGNGLRAAFSKQTLSLVNYLKVCKELKIHPAFIHDKNGGVSEYFYTKKPDELNLAISGIQDLKAEINALKEKLSKLPTRYIDLMETKGKK